MAETLRDKKRRILGNKSNYLKNRTGVLSNLGSLGQFISDDTNNLDNLSFATDKGLKVNLANNRNKEAGDPKIKIEDMDFSGSSLVGASALNNSMGSEPAMQPRWDGLIKNNKDNRNNATLGFIETNSAKKEFKPYYLPIGDSEEYYVESPEEEDFLLNSTIEERNAYFSMSPEEVAEFLATRVPPKNRFGHEVGFEHPKNTDLYQVLDDVDPLMSVLDGDEFVGQDDAEMSAIELSPYDEAVADGNMDLAKNIREKGNADNYKRFEELKLLYPNQGLTSRYYPDVDYSNPDLLAQLKRKNDENLGDVFDLHNPFDWTIGYADNKENKHKYDSGGDSGLLQYWGVDLREDEIEKINLANRNNLLNETEDSLILEDISKRKEEEEAAVLKLAADKRDFAALGGGDVFDLQGFLPDRDIDLRGLEEAEEKRKIEEEALIENAVDIEQGLTEQGLTEQDQVPMTNLDQSLDGSNYDELLKQETAMVQEDAVVSESAEVLNANEETRRIREEADAVIDGNDDDETKESKLAGLFGSLKDIFGVDNKSLLRAFIKYVGGRAFGMSSGKAAQFAWAGIEADMATEAARGAEARKYADNMSEYKLQHSQALKDKDFDKAEMIMKKMLDYSGVDKSDPEKYYEGLEFLQNKKAELMASSDPKDKELIQAIDDQINKWESAGIGGSTTPQPTYDIRVQDEMGNERTLNARDGANGREVQMPNGKFVPLKDYKSEGFGSIVHASKVNASDAGPVPFKMAGGRYNAEDDAEFEAQLDAIDAKLESGGYGEGEDAEAAAYNDRAKVHNLNNNRNENGELYSKKVPYATGISDTGVVYFPEFKGDEKKSAYQLAEGVRGLAKLKAIQSNPKAMAMVNKWQAQWESIATGNAESYGAIRSYISKEFKANPLQQAYYMGMLELTTSKLRRDTGAAYNTKEMYDTMTRYTNYSDTTGDVTSMKLAGAEVDLEAIAGMTRSGQYWLGVMDGTYRPSNSWQTMMGSIYNMMETEGVYNNSGDGGKKVVINAEVEKRYENVGVE